MSLPRTLRCSCLYIVAGGADMMSPGEVICFPCLLPRGGVQGVGGGGGVPPVVVAEQGVCPVSLEGGDDGGRQERNYKHDSWELE